MAGLLLLLGLKTDSSHEGCAGGGLRDGVDELASPAVASTLNGSSHEACLGESVSVEKPISAIASTSNTDSSHDGDLLTVFAAA